MTRLTRDNSELSQVKISEIQSPKSKWHYVAALGWHNHLVSLRESLVRSEHRELSLSVFTSA